MKGLSSKRRFKIIEGQEDVLINLLRKLNDHREDYSKFINEYLKSRFGNIPTEIICNENIFPINRSNTVYKYLINGDEKGEQKVSYLDINKLLYFLITVDTYAQNEEEYNFFYNYNLNEINKILTKCIDTTVTNEGEFLNFKNLIECFSEDSIHGNCTLKRDKDGAIYITTISDDEVLSVEYSSNSTMSLVQNYIQYNDSSYRFPSDLFMGNPLKVINNQINRLLGKKRSKLALYIFFIFSTFGLISLMALYYDVFFKTETNGVDYPLSYSWISSVGSLIFTMLAIKAIEGAEALSLVVETYFDDKASYDGLTFEQATLKKMSKEKQIKIELSNEIGIYTAIAFGFSLSFVTHTTYLNDTLCGWTEVCDKDLISVAGFSILGIYHFIVSVFLYSFLYNLVFSMVKAKSQIDKFEDFYKKPNKNTLSYYTKTFPQFSNLIDKYIQILIGITSHGILIISNAFFLYYYLEYQSVYAWQWSYLIFVLIGGSGLGAFVFKQKNRLSKITEIYKENLLAKVDKDRDFISHIIFDSNDSSTKQEKFIHLINLPETIDNKKLKNSMLILFIFVTVLLVGLINFLLIS